MSKSVQISAEQIRKFETYAAEIFTAMGLNLNTEATKDTPRRYIAGDDRGNRGL